MASTSDGGNEGQAPVVYGYQANVLLQQGPNGTKVPDCLRGRPMVGHRVCVWWPRYERYYSGVVAKHKTGQNKPPYFIKYDDKDRRWCNLSKEKWMFSDQDQKPVPELARQMVLSLSPAHATRSQHGLQSQRSTPTAAAAAAGPSNPGAPRRRAARERQAEAHAPGSAEAEEQRHTDQRGSKRALRGTSQPGSGGTDTDEEGQEEEEEQDDTGAQAPPSKQARQQPVGGIRALRPSGAAALAPAPAPADGAGPSGLARGGVRTVSGLQAAGERARAAYGPAPVPHGPDGQEQPGNGQLAELPDPPIDPPMQPEAAERLAEQVKRTSTLQEHLVNVSFATLLSGMEVSTAQALLGSALPAGAATPTVLDVTFVPKAKVAARAAGVPEQPLHFLLAPCDGDQVDAAGASGSGAGPGRRWQLMYDESTQQLQPDLAARLLLTGKVKHAQVADAGGAEQGRVQSLELGVGLRALKVKHESDSSTSTGSSSGSEHPADAPVSRPRAAPRHDDADGGSQQRTGAERAADAAAPAAANAASAPRGMAAGLPHAPAAGAGTGVVHQQHPVASPAAGAPGNSGSGGGGAGQGTGPACGGGGAAAATDPAVPVGAAEKRRLLLKQLREDCEGLLKIKNLNPLSLAGLLRKLVQQPDERLRLFDEELAPARLAASDPSQEGQLIAAKWVLEGLEKL